MIRLEVDEDSYEMPVAFLVWCAIVASLWLYSRRVQARDRQRIDAAAAADVERVRQRLPRRAPSVQADGTSTDASASPVAGAASGEREDCPICLTTVSWPIDTNCDHTYCASCFLAVYEHGSGSAVKCPCCRRVVDVILPSEPGWTPDETDSEQGRKLRREIDDYNARFSSEPRGIGEMARDAPHYLRRFWTELTSGGPRTMRIIRQARLWLIIGSAFLYLLSPFDLIPESLFGLFGLLDDVFVLIAGLIMVGGVFRNAQLQQARQGL